MNKLMNNEYGQVLLVAIGFVFTFFVCGVVIPFGIKLFFKGLLYMMNEPLISLSVISAFLIGFFVGNLKNK